MHDFWSHRWHQLFRCSFIVLSGLLLSILFGHLGYIFGSFLASGIFHYAIMVMFTEIWCMVFLFGMMIARIVLEDVFTTLLTGCSVGRWKGWLWTIAVGKPDGGWECESRHDGKPKHVG